MPKKKQRRFWMMPVKKQSQSLLQLVKQQRKPLRTPNRKSSFLQDRLSQFVGKATVIDCTDLGEGGSITMEQVRKNPAAEQADFLLFHTGWGKYWGKPEYYGDYPCVTNQVVDFLIQTGKKGVGLDTISLDPIASLTLHRQLLSTNKTVIIENLNNLDKLPQGLFTFCALPLRYEQADGSPIRAVALLEASSIF